MPWLLETMFFIGNSGKIFKGKKFLRENLIRYITEMNGRKMLKIVKVYIQVYPLFREKNSQKFPI